MTKSKRFRDGLEKIDLMKEYEASEAIDILKKFPATKFDESVEIAIKLGIDPRQADQNIRGAFSMPNGIGKEVRVIAFVDDSLVDAAKEAGAVEAGGQELAEKIKTQNWFDFDVAVAEPRMMRVVGQLGRILGPKGLMPSPKAGTVVPNPVDAVREFSAGKQEYKNDSNGNIHMIIGRKSFESEKLVENLKVFVSHILHIKPFGVRGTYMQNVSVSTTMGPGLKIAFQR